MVCWMKSLLFLLEGNNLKIPKSGERELCTIRAAQIRSDKGSYLALGISFQKDGNLDTCRSKLDVMSSPLSPFI